VVAAFRQRHEDIALNLPIPSEFLHVI
jgi:hypothetical protein